MAKIIKKEESIIDPTIERDSVELNRLKKIVNPSPTDIDSIYYMYRTYVEKGALPPITSCYTCHRSISSYFWKIVGLDPNNLIKL